MRILSCELKNFASYESLNFDFSKQGLCLIQGPTGSGKSTLCDAIPWVLFGTTAKNGAVTDVISWPGDKVTSGVLLLELFGQIITITRHRGAPKDNDLYFTIRDDKKIRGKDLNDTQTMINRTLGMTVDLYLAGAYYHEFSQTAQFFTTNAKNRRVICEQLVDLSMPKTLQEKASQRTKDLTKQNNALSNRIQVIAGKVDLLVANSDYQKQYENFEKDKASAIMYKNTQIASLSASIKPPEYFKEGFKELTDTINLLDSEVCSECGNKKNGDKISELRLLLSELNHEKRINDTNKMQADRLHSELKKLQESENIYQQLMDKASKDLEIAIVEQERALKEQDSLQRQLADLDLLSEIVSNFRRLLITNTVQDLEDRTNKLLVDHFDAEIKVIFSAEDADKIDIEILKDGNLCSYSQLSKGQRQLLKLSFGVAVMRNIANFNSNTFNAIFIDEAFDGLSDEFKVKAFRLLTTLELEYESIFVVEHSEALKSLFHSTYSVSLVNGKSVLNYE